MSDPVTLILWACAFGLWTSVAVLTLLTFCGLLLCAPSYLRDLWTAFTSN